MYEEKPKKISTPNWLISRTLGSRPIVPKSIPGFSDFRTLKVGKGSFCIGRINLVPLKVYFVTIMTSVMAAQIKMV